MENYITLSLETHLFFARIMKEHALFLAAGFPCKNEEWIRRADFFRQQFEAVLGKVVHLSDGRVNSAILNSNEAATEFTVNAEKRTEVLSGIPINTVITEKTLSLASKNCKESNMALAHTVHQLNEQVLNLLSGLIDFKEDILREVGSCRLFTTNYPLLIKHILREAKLYRDSISNLMNDKQCSYQKLYETEEFWNRIMMEHALFIRGLLDPNEEELIDTADSFAKDYKRLLELAKKQDARVSAELHQKTLAETLRYRDFKAAGTEGILNCDIESIILPLLADHVLREANHYIRILRSKNK